MSELRLDVDLLHTRGRVWRALTDPQLLSSWFQPMTEEGRITPTEELPSFAPFDLEVVESVAPDRLVWRWHGEDFSSAVEWELTPVGEGCRLSLRQAGFLGSHEASRRTELLAGYPSMFDRLKVLLDRLAAGDPVVDPLVPRPEPVPADRRMRLLSLVGAAVLVVLCATAGAVWINRGDPVPLGERRGFGLGTGNQPGIGPLPSGTPSPSPSAVPLTASASVPAPGSPGGSASPSPEVLSASYRTVALLGLGGFDTEVTVRGVAHTSWTVVLTMPDATQVENRSSSLVKMVQDGKIVTLTPVGSDLPIMFVIRFPALLALGKSVESCTVDGQPCAAK